MRNNNKNSNKKNNDNNNNNNEMGSHTGDYHHLPLKNIIVDFFYSDNNNSNNYNDINKVIINTHTNFREAKNTTFKLYSWFNLLEHNSNIHTILILLEKGYTTNSDLRKVIGLHPTRVSNILGYFLGLGIIQELEKDSLLYYYESTKQGMNSHNVSLLRCYEMTELAKKFYRTSDIYDDMTQFAPKHLKNYAQKESKKSSEFINNTQILQKIPLKQILSKYPTSLAELEEIEVCNAYQYLTTDTKFLEKNTQISEVMLTKFTDSIISLLGKKLKNNPKNYINSLKNIQKIGIIRC